jgi:hypothetical protein
MYYEPPLVVKFTSITFKYISKGYEIIKILKEK